MPGITFRFAVGNKRHPNFNLTLAPNVNLQPQNYTHLTKMHKSTIKPGDYIIVQRQDYTKLHKLKQHGTITMGNFVIELDSIVGCRYFDTFQMILNPDSKKLYKLERVEEITRVTQQLNIERSGKDNRNITDDGDSQQMTKDDIMKLKDNDVSSSDIVGMLVGSSKTFASKTEFSQEKYLKKKEKKYFEYVQIRRPTIRLLSQMFFRQDPSKTQGLRLDDLSQILTYSNVQSEGNYILYDSGTSGLVTAAFMNTIGAETTGKLVHMHPGNECQKNAFVAMQFGEEQAKRCVNVNIYSVLRCFYQNKGTYGETNGCMVAATNERVAEETSDGTVEHLENESNQKSGKKRKLEDGEVEVPAKKKPCWQFDNERACEILKEKTDGLIIISKEHPLNLVKELIAFLKGGRNLIVFNLLKEPLQEVFVYLKSRTDFLNIRLSNNFLRYYQVLPERTHPQVNMNSGGYILTAVKLVS